MNQYVSCEEKRTGAISALVLLIITTTLFGCAHAPLSLHVYGDSRQEQVRKIVEGFADPRGIKIRRPPVAPAESVAEVTLVHGSSILAATTAWEIAELLDAGGIGVSIKNSVFKNHLVTANRIAVFVRGANSKGETSLEYKDFSQLLCVKGEDYAVVLLHIDGTADVETYLWTGQEIAGRNYRGNTSCVSRLEKWSLWNSKSRQRAPPGRTVVFGMAKLVLARILHQCASFRIQKIDLYCAFRP